MAVAAASGGLLAVGLLVAPFVDRVDNTERLFPGLLEMAIVALQCPRQQHPHRVHPLSPLAKAGAMVRDDHRLSLKTPRIRLLYGMGKRRQRRKKVIAVLLLSTIALLRVALCESSSCGRGGSREARGVVATWRSRGDRGTIDSKERGCSTRESNPW